MWSYVRYRGVAYNLRRGPVLSIPPTRPTIYSNNSVHFRGPLIWNKLPNLFNFLYFCLSHEDTNHLTLYCSQMTGCYMICKNAENVEHLGYWLGLCRFLCHCVCHLCEYFLIFVSWFLLAISYVFTPTLNKVIIHIIKTCFKMLQ